MGFLTTQFKKDMARIGQRSSSSPPPGEWVRGKMVGSGSFGTVHLATNNATGSLFVVKSTQSKAGHQFLENEAEILESLNSPHIVRCLGRELLSGGNGKKELNRFTEYMAGGSLSEVAEIFGGALDERVVRLYTREILLGLNHLHKNGIVHCDLKCENVLLGPSGDVKLADFGCAKRMKDLKKEKKKGRTRTNSIQSSKSVAGTPLWAAVEVSKPLAAVMKSACSDDERPRLPPDFSEEGLDFPEKCSSRNPGKRWTTEKLLTIRLLPG